MKSLVPTAVNQAGAIAQGNIVAGPNIEYHEHHAPGGAGVVEALLQKLNAEIEDKAHTSEIIDRLQRFYERRADDDIVGLQAKLKAAGREPEYRDALERKEMFAKLLERWSLYASAQLIFVHLLARAEHRFNYIVHPQISVLDVVQVNSLTNNLIVEPTVGDCGASVFAIDHNAAMGMLYWLAEQCFVRWHK